ncbi:MAG: GNAT family N-acetyltransferase [Oscillospiraceae bacterium]|nr:GNAT family N-acetyltransferase [Oscillospiraceae bacterium]
MTTIYIIRHAEAEGNIYRRIHGHYDGHITPNGRLQIEALRRRFTEVSVDAVYSSDLTRAYQTALAIAEPKRLTVTKLPELREINMGDWEDTCWGYWETFEPDRLADYNFAPLKWYVNGCESISDTQKRMIAALRDIAARHDGQSAAVVTHGVAIRAVLCFVRGITLDNVNEISYCDNTAVAKLLIAGSETRLEYMNDNSHLPEEISTFARQNWWKNKSATDDRNLYFEPIPFNEAGRKYLADAYADSGLEYSPSSEKYIRPLYAMRYGKECGAAVLDAVKYAGEGAGSVELFYLAPEFRGLGYAVQLLGAATSEFRGAGLNKIRMFTPENNASAVKFCARAGFTRVSADRMINGMRNFAYEFNI